MQRWWIVKDKKTGKHLPWPKMRNSSATYVKLTDEQPPRLFSRRESATQAMACWKKGILQSDRHVSYGKVKLSVAHLPKDRADADLEVVEVELNYVTNES